MNKAIIFDRDGTINIDTGYIHKEKDFVFKPTAISAIKKLNDNDYRVIVITNQSGIGRGLYKKEDVDSLHEYINQVLEKHSAKIDAFYYCPHKPEEHCICRKPKTYFHQKAISEYNIYVKKLTLIGDKKSDVLPASDIGCNFFWLKDNIDLIEVIDRIIWRDSS